MKLRELKSYLLVLYVCVFLFVIFKQINIIDPDENEHFRYSIGRTHDMDRELNQLVYRAWYGQLDGNAPLLEVARLVKESKKDIQAAPQFLPKKGQAKLNRLLENYRSTLGLRERLLAEFMKQKDRFTRTLLSLGRMETKEKELEGGTPDFFADMLIWDLYMGQNLSGRLHPTGLQTHVKELERIRRSLLETGKGGDELELVTEVLTLQRSKSAADSIANRIVTLPLDDQADAIFQECDASFEQVLKEVNYYRLLLVAMSVVLAVYTAYTMVKLKRSALALQTANETLENRVEERTLTLTRLNAELNHEVEERERGEAALKQNNKRLEWALVELEQAQQQVIQQERLRAVGEMASGIAHDFNNSLVPIAGYTELLMLRPEYRKDDEKASYYLSTILRASQDAAHTVSRLKEFYRFREDNEAFGPIDLNTLIEQSVDLTRPRWKDQAQAEGREIQVRLDLGEIPPLQGIEAKMRDLLANLIFNAVDALPEGGIITLSTRFRDDKTIILEVRDTGVGMTEAVRKRCLEPFFSTKGEKGTGLGLSTVYGNVQRHGGKIEVKSKEGEGTVFRIAFPMQQREEEQEASVGVSPPASSARSLRILLVDDDPMVREVVEEHLLLLGHTVETASDGLEALKRTQESMYDIVFTDRAMPGLNGDQLAQAISTGPSKTPVVLLTGFGDFMRASNELPPGVNLILSKPVKQEDLIHAIEALTASQTESLVGVSSAA
jgi:signal transduction histidine kinase/ActR/RegA family two-component response regulator